MKGEKRTEETDRADNNREKKLDAWRIFEELCQEFDKGNLSGQFGIEISAKDGRFMRVGRDLKSYS